LQSPTPHDADADRAPSATAVWQPPSTPHDATAVATPDPAPDPDPDPDPDDVRHPDTPANPIHTS
jgi:hypothetical protein